MRKVHFLLAASALLVIILISCLRHSSDSPSILKVVFNGPFVMLRTKTQPDRITVFSPRDPKDRHQVYINDLNNGMAQTVHVTLSGGLEPSKDWLIDPYFPRDFVVNTETWKRPPDGDPTKDYMATIELPLPEKITFTPPLYPVTLADGSQSLMATNFVLEYKVTNFSNFRATSPELKSLNPLSSSALEKQYRDLCDGSDVRQKYYESCVDIRNLLEQNANAKTAVFFFGVGIPKAKQMYMTDQEIDAHAIEFFNVMLQSFPKWTGPRLGPGAFGPERSTDSTAMLMKASFRPAAPYPQARPVFYTAVIDCKATNLIVTAKETKQ